jgi:tRNA nucleotidyltransferase (CCA-adding enzyme)
MKEEEKAPQREEETGIFPDVITTHVNADFDALASVIAASKLYPGAALVFPGSQEKNLRDFFLQSTSYLFSFKKYKQISCDHVKRLILVDTRQKGRIGPFASLAERPGIEIHVYDHHPDSEDDVRSDLSVVRRTGSTTTILSSIIRERGLKVTPDEATIMCLGIHEDTGSFTFASTCSEDYAEAAWLTSQGADHNLIASMLTRELSSQHVTLLYDLMHSATYLHLDGIEITIAKVTRDEYVGDFAVVIHKFMDMENLNVLFGLAQMEDRVYLVARSRIPEVNVAEIAVAFGGGGHPQAASATIKDKTLIQIERQLRETLATRIRPFKTARDMMSSPVIHITTGETIKTAANLLTRYNINVLLVLDEAGDLKGYLTRQVVEKAAYFGLDNLKVDEYMNIEFSTVAPDAPLEEVKDLIIRRKLRILPVMEGRQLVGVITRTDILNILVGEEILSEDSGGQKTRYPMLRKKNMTAIMRERVPKRITDILSELGHVADLLGYNAYVVGGFVRDLFLRRENLDVDVVVEGDGIAFAQEFARYANVRVRSHKKFGTAVLIFPDNYKVDVATARMEYYESPGAPPIIETSSLKLDLYRRDFTINTLAIKLNKKHYGTLIDYFGGQADIKEKWIRVLHNLSFVEDPTRALRAVRFEQRFGFKIGKLTAALMRNAVKINSFKDTAGHRLFLELKLILKEDDPTSAIMRMDDFDLLKFLLPGIRADGNLRFRLENTKKVLAWYQLLYLKDPIEPWIVYWHGLASGLGERELRDAAVRFAMSESEKKVLLEEHLAISGLLNQLIRFHGSNYALHKMLAPYSDETILHIMALSENEKVKRLISLFFTKIKGARCALRGKDLIKMGLKAGPVFKKILDRLLEARLNEEVRTREEELELAKSIINGLNSQEKETKGESKGNIE